MNFNCSSDEDCDDIVEPIGRGKFTSNRLNDFAKLKGFQKCKYCFKEVRSNVKRHEISCSLNTSKMEFLCEKCAFVFSRIDNLKKHIVKCNGMATKKLISCMYEKCSKSFARKSTLIDHIKLKHDSQIKDPILITFPSMVDFENWKNDEEEKTYSYYSKQYGKKRSNKNDLIYFYCQHDGSSRAHRKKGEPSRLTNRKNKFGQVKTDKKCISLMSLKIDEDGTCHLKYFPSHSHRLAVDDIKFHPQSKETYKFIDRQIDLNISPTKIVQSLRECEKSQDRILTKTQLITKNAIRLRALRKKASIYSDNDANHEDQFQEVLILEDPDVSLVYSPPEKYSEEYSTSSQEINSLPNTEQLFTPKKCFLQNEMSNKDLYIQEVLPEFSIKPQNNVIACKANIKTLFDLVSNENLPQSFINLISSNVLDLLRKYENFTSSPELVLSKKNSIVIAPVNKLNCQNSVIRKFFKIQKINYNKNDMDSPPKKIKIKEDLEEIQDKKNTNHFNEDAEEKLHSSNELLPVYLDEVNRNNISTSKMQSPLHHKSCAVVQHAENIVNWDHCYITLQSANNETI